MEEQKLTREEWKASEGARKKFDELEKRRVKAVETAVKGRHAYYDKLREALLSSLPPGIQASLRAEFGVPAPDAAASSSEEPEELDAADAPEVTEE